MIHNPEVRIEKMLRMIRSARMGDTVYYERSVIPVFFSQKSGFRLRSIRKCRAAAKREMRGVRRKVVPGCLGVPGYSVSGIAGATPESAVKRAYRRAFVEAKELLKWLKLRKGS